jgi:SET domain-containing protein
MYRPLPKQVTIKKSEIDGLGLFSTEEIPSGTDLGMTHIYDDRFQDYLIRLPLGGFFNHSETPNCDVIEKWYDERNKPVHHLRLITNKTILEGEELTAKYTIYDPTK